MFLFQETHILPFFAMKPHGEQRVANLLKLVELANNLAAQSPMSFRSFVEFLTGWEGVDQPESESPLIEEAGNAVSIMTIHKAKGMEFPVVILGDGMYSGRKDAPIIAFDRGAERLELRLGKELETDGYAELLEAMRAKSQAEEIRLLYVAATRAKEMLVLPAYDPLPEKGFLSPLAGPLAEMAREGDPRVIFRRPPDTVENRETVPEAAVDSWREGDLFLEMPPEQQEDARNWETTAKASIQNASRPRWLSVSEIVHHGTDEGAVTGGGGARLGSFVHELLQRASLLEDNLPLWSSRLAAKYSLSEDGLQDGLRMARWALSAPAVVRARSCGRFFQEVPFLCPHGAIGLEGVIDLVFEEQGKLIVVDFKTDRVEGELLTKRLAGYRPQGEFYADAMERITGIGVRECVFLFLWPGIEKRFRFKGLSRTVEAMLPHEGP
jgi:ATP-dependent helicase/nuclease subunit A